MSGRGFSQHEVKDGRMTKTTRTNVVLQAASPPPCTEHRKSEGIRQGAGGRRMVVNARIDVVRRNCKPTNKYWSPETIAHHQILDHQKSTNIWDEARNGREASSSPSPKHSRSNDTRPERPRRHEPTRTEVAPESCRSITRVLQVARSITNY